MTLQIVEETAATAHESSPKTDVDAATSMQQEDAGPPYTVRIARPGLLIAGFVLSAALTSGSATGAIPLTAYIGRKRDETAMESGTAATECDPELINQIRELFEQGASEFFEDGIHSAFSRALLLMLAQHGRAAFQAIAEYLFSGDPDPDVVSEALRWLADFGDPMTIRERWSILQRSLRNHSPRIRDGAILGFAALDDPRARPVLFEARDVEQIAELRRLIDQVIHQLDATAHGATAAHRPPEPMA